MRNSIFLKITILFIIAIVGIGAFSHYFIQMQINNESEQNKRKYGQFLATIEQLVRFNLGNADTVKKYIQELNLQSVKDPKILKLFTHQLVPNLQNGVLTKILSDEDHVYLLVQTPDSWGLYRDVDPSMFANYYFITAIALMVVIGLFFLVVQSLFPLKSLRTEIRKFAHGERDIQCRVWYNDEIGEVAQEFNNAVKNINALNQSRHLFLRSIMHELKTPITKGRIVAEMIADDTQKTRLCSVFDRLNTLINDFARIEALSSRVQKMKCELYPLSEILDYVFEMLLIDKADIPDLFELHIHENPILSVDFEFFSLALKNLLDNALKYRSYINPTPDLEGKKPKVTITIHKTNLYIQNEGKPLPGDIKQHAQPFFKDKNTPDSGGLGLGIYIAKNTLEAQGFELAYKYKNHINHFIILNCIKTKG